MDPETSHNLDIRIIASNLCARWFSINKIIDSDITNFKDFVDDILEEYPCSYGNVVKVFCFCADSKANIETSSDKDLV
jgi:hypothetical protein